jgi:hypothetical protein
LAGNAGILDILLRQLTIEKFLFDIEQKLLQAGCPRYDISRGILKKMYKLKVFAIALLAFVLACETNVATQAQQDKPNAFSPTVAKPKLDAIENESINKRL